MRTRILAINRETANFYFRCLTANQDKRGLQYLISRKLKPETIRKYGLGYAPDSWNLLTDHLLKKGFTEEELLLADVHTALQRAAGFMMRSDAVLCSPLWTPEVL